MRPRLARLPVSLGLLVLCAAGLATTLLSNPEAPVPADEEVQARPASAQPPPTPPAAPGTQVRPPSPRHPR